MTKLLVHIKGKGNGLVTVLSNLDDVAREVSRPPAYILRFLHLELDTITKGDRATRKWLVCGLHSPQKLEHLIEAFVSQFVTCSHCSSKTTVLFVNTKASPPTVSWVCRDCCQTTLVDATAESSAFRRQDLIDFIIKHPPVGTDGDILPTPRRLRMK